MNLKTEGDEAFIILVAGINTNKWMSDECTG
jgi:hypothetical protein